MAGPRHNRCSTGSQRDLNLGSPVIEYASVTLTFPFVGLPRVMRDVPMGFAKPHKIVGVASVTIGDPDCNIYLHFYPLNYPAVIPPAGSITIIPTGSEPWIPLSSTAGNSAGRVTGRFIVFNKPIQNFFFDADHPNGGVGNGIVVTFFGTDDIEAALLERL